MREYQLLKIGLSLADIENGSALMCDWLLKIEDAVNEGVEARNRSAR